jgi:hypothetical protein
LVRDVKASVARGDVDDLEVFAGAD